MDENQIASFDVSGGVTPFRVSSQKCRSNDLQSCQRFRREIDRLEGFVSGRAVRGLPIMK